MERKLAISGSAITLESTWAAMQMMTKDDQYEAIRLMFNYSFYEEEIKTDNPLVNMIILQALPNLQGAKQRYNSAVENGKKGGRPPQYDVETIVKLIKEGYTQNQVAKELDCHVNTVKSAIRSYKNGEKQVKEELPTLDFDFDTKPKPQPAVEKEEDEDELPF